MKKRIYALVSIIALLFVMCPFGMVITSNDSTIVNDYMEFNGEISKANAMDSVKTILGSQFLENVGQFPAEEVLFYGRIPGGFIGFAASRALLWMNGACTPVELTFEGTPQVFPVGTYEVAHRTNYFLGNRGTFTGVRGFTQIVYNDLWPGINLNYQVTASGAKYEFEIAPGAEPTDIAIRISGHDSLEVDSTTIVMEKNDVTILDEGLTVFQEDVVVDANFEALGADMFGFHIGDYDPSSLLVIDPMLYSTYLGGTGKDQGVSIDVDLNGDVYVLIGTDSTDIDTSGDDTTPFNDTASGMNDVLVAKLDPDLGSLVYATYVGGIGYDNPYAIAVDSNGVANVIGETYSPDFPIYTGPLPDDTSVYLPLNDTINNGNGDAFIFRLGIAGDEILGSSFIGLGSRDSGVAIAADSNQIFITGFTHSPNFRTYNAYDDTHNGLRDIFVMKLRVWVGYQSFGIQYSTFVGGADFDVPHSIAIDSNKSAYIAGETDSADFPINYTIGTRGGNDAFVVKLGTTGQFHFSTLVCGETTDKAHDVAVDSLGRVYITGGTDSDPFEAVAEADEYGTRGGNSDCYVIQLKSTGETVLHSFLISGVDTDIGNSIALDSTENGVYVGGYTKSDDFPTPNGNYTEKMGWADGFLFKIDWSGLVYSTYVGGGQEDSIEAIVIDQSNHILATGYANESAVFPITDGAYQEVNKGGRDAFVFKHSELIKPTLNQPDNVVYLEGTTGHRITWTGNDDHPGSYEVGGNWTLMGDPPHGPPFTGSWTSGPIEVNIDGLSVGIHMVIIRVMDQYGNWVSDSVIVQVEYDPIPPIFFWAEVIGALAAVGTAIGWLIRRASRKRRIELGPE